MRLQYSAMGSLGTTWIDCNESKANRLIQEAVDFYSQSADEIMTGLLEGFIVSTGSGNSTKLRDHNSVESVKIEAAIAKNAAEILLTDNEPEFI